MRATNGWRVVPQRPYDLNVICSATRIFREHSGVGSMTQRRTATALGAIEKLGLRLQSLRQLQKTTQSSLARELGIGQTALSHLERRDDILLSTLEAYVEALGGQLHVAASFSNAELIPLIGNSSGLPQEAPKINPVLEDPNQPLLPHIAAPSPMPSARDVIFSIRPVHAAKILEGSKTVELRRRFTGGVRPGALALIYSTSPTSALTGTARIKEVQKLPIPDLWQKHRAAACLKKQEFENYFAGLKLGYAIVLNSAKPLPRPVGLVELRQRFGFEPPQSYQYISADIRALVM